MKQRALIICTLLLCLPLGARTMRTTGKPKDTRPHSRAQFNGSRFSESRFTKPEYEAWKRLKLLSLKKMGKTTHDKQVETLTHEILEYAESTTNSSSLPHIKSFLFRYNYLCELHNRAQVVSLDQVDYDWLAGMIKTTYEKWRYSIRNTMQAQGIITQPQQQQYLAELIIRMFYTHHNPEEIIFAYTYISGLNTEPTIEAVHEIDQESVFITALWPEYDRWKKTISGDEDDITTMLVHTCHELLAALQPSRTAYEANKEALNTLLFSYNFLAERAEKKLIIHVEDIDTSWIRTLQKEYPYIRPGEQPTYQAWKTITLRTMTKAGITSHEDRQQYLARLLVSMLYTMPNDAKTLYAYNTLAELSSRPVLTAINEIDQAWLFRLALREAFAQYKSEATHNYPGNALLAKQIQDAITSFAKLDGQVTKSYESDQKQLKSLFFAYAMLAEELGGTPVIHIDAIDTAWLTTLQDQYPTRLYATLEKYHSWKATLPEEYTELASGTTAKKIHYILSNPLQKILIYGIISTEDHYWYNLLRELLDLPFDLPTSARTAQTIILDPTVYDVIRNAGKTTYYYTELEKILETGADKHPPLLLPPSKGVLELLEESAPPCEAPIHLFGGRGGSTWPVKKQGSTIYHALKVDTNEDRDTALFILFHELGHIEHDDGNAHKASLAITPEFTADIIAAREYRELGKKVLNTDSEIGRFILPFLGKFSTYWINNNPFNRLAYLKRGQEIRADLFALRNLYYKGELNAILSSIRHLANDIHSKHPSSFVVYDDHDPHPSMLERLLYAVGFLASHSFEVNVLIKNFEQYGQCPHFNREFTHPDLPYYEPFERSYREAAQDLLQRKGYAANLHTHTCRSTAQNKSPHKKPFHSSYYV